MKLAVRTGLAAAVAAAALAAAAVPAGAAVSTRTEHALADAPTVADPKAITPAAGTLEYCHLATGPQAHQDVAGTPAVAHQGTIHASAFNQARSILARAGSDTAAKTHPIHGTGNVPVWYGTTLLACSRDEFRYKDRNDPLKHSGMSPYHYVAIHDAARTMGIDRW